MMIKGAIDQDGTIILNVYVPNNNFKRYEAITKEMLGEMDKLKKFSEIIVNSTSIINKTSRHKINKYSIDDFEIIDWFEYSSSSEHLTMMEDIYKSQ